MTKGTKQKNKIKQIQNACSEITEHVGKRTYTSYLCMLDDKIPCDFFKHKDYIDNEEPCTHQCVCLCFNQDAVKHEKERQIESFKRQREENQKFKQERETATMKSETNNKCKIGDTISFFKGDRLVEAEVTLTRKGHAIVKYHNDNYSVLTADIYKNITEYKKRNKKGK